jgi:elongation factor 1-gamma
MTHFGTIYTYPGSVLTARVEITAQYTGKDVTFDKPAFDMGTENKSPEFLAKFPAGTVPAMETTDGVCLWDSSAIAYYVAAMNDCERLTGTDAKSRAEILQWIVYSNSRFAETTRGWVGPIIGYYPYNKVAHTQAIADTKNCLALFNQHLLHHTYLVGESITLADISVVTQLSGLYRMVLSPEIRATYKNLLRYFMTCANQPEFKAVLGEPVLCAEEMKYQPPKKEKKEKPQQQPKKATPAPAAANDEDDDDEEEAEVSKPKAKNPLDLLPPSKFNLEDWKRFYSNNDTKPAAMNYFWEHFDPEGFSIWRVDYKYNDELAKVFMSANLIGGFYARIERAKKYAFGSLVVLGEDNKNEIAGFFVVRGQQVPFEITDAADYDSYSFEKVDHTDEAIRTQIADYFAWEGNFGGKPCPDGKVFK